MSRTYRRRWLPDPTRPNDLHLTEGPEASCKPGCNTCGKGPENKRRESKRGRATKPRDIEEQT